MVANHGTILLPWFNNDSWADPLRPRLGSGPPSRDAERDLGMGDGESVLTNRQIMDLIHPGNPKVPYVYNNFNAWGNVTDWDPCVECSSAARDEIATP